MYFVFSGIQILNKKNNIQYEVLIPLENSVINWWREEEEKNYLMNGKEAKSQTVVFRSLIHCTHVTILCVLYHRGTIKNLS